MKKNTNMYKLIHILFLVALFGMFILCLAASVTKSHDYVDKMIPDYKEISESFHLTPDGNEFVDFSYLGQYVSSDSKTLVLYCRLPEITKDTTLIYRSKDVYTSLFLGDKLIYETSVPNSRFYNKSPGNLWNMVTLDSSCSGALLTLKIDIVYNNKAVTVDNIYFGDSTNIIVNYVKEKMPAIIISFVMILLGIYMIIRDILTRIRTIHTTHGLLYLGIYSFLIGVWSLLETNTVQFFVSDQRILQLMNNIVMITDTFPLFIYLDCEYNAFKNPVIRAVSIADLAYIFVCIFTQFIGKYDLHNLLLGAQIALLTGNITVIAWILYTYVRNRKNKREVSPLILHMIGVSLLFFTAMSEYLRYSYTSSDTADRAELLRLGMFLFIIFFSAGSHIQTSRLVEKGLKYSIVSNLAYSDGLTNLGNRTAFLEQLDAYSKSHLPSLGVVFLDINNLKIVNDQKGHEMGDILIKEASDIIRNSFGKYGKCYRIGGDEFCVLLENENLKSIYEAALEDFRQLIVQTNENDSYSLEIQIAQGFSICTDTTREKIEETINQADQAMYENKAKMKENAL